MSNSLRSLQQAWARYIRDPSQVLPAGMAANRMALYRTLCLGGVDGLLAGSFPRLREALGESRWSQTVNAFYAGHRCTTPLFPELGGEWFVYLQEDSTLPEWAIELAHFEWTQQQLLMADTIAVDAATSVMLEAPLTLAPLARVCGYRWPVDRSPASTHATPPAEPTLLLLQRNADHTLRITRLSVFDYQLLRAIADRPLIRAEQLLHAMARECGEPLATIIQHGLNLLARLQAQGVVYSTTHAPKSSHFTENGHELR